MVSVAAHPIEHRVTRERRCHFYGCQLVARPPLLSSSRGVYPLGAMAYPSWSERDVNRTLIRPAIEPAGWDFQTLVRGRGADREPNAGARRMGGSRQVQRGQLCLSQQAQHVVGVQLGQAAAPWAGRPDAAGARPRRDARCSSFGCLRLSTNDSNGLSRRIATRLKLEECPSSRGPAVAPCTGSGSRPRPPAFSTRTTMRSVSARRHDISTCRPSKMAHTVVHEMVV